MVGFGDWRVSAWLGRLLAERVSSQWRRDEQRALETLRRDLAGNRILLDAAIRSHASGQDLFQQRRVAAVERLWTAVLELRDRLSGPVFFFGLLLPSEYDSVFEKGGAFAASIAELTDNTIVGAMMPAREVENDRPHLGDTLWLQFFIYRAFLGRLAHLVVEGKRHRHIPDWREDNGVSQLLGYVLPEQTVVSLLGSKKDPSAVNKATNMLESLILREISLITSGRRSSLESFENAKELREALLGAKPTGV